jgi:hypothetical protein
MKRKALIAATWVFPVLFVGLHTLIAHQLWIQL